MMFRGKNLNSFELVSVHGGKNGLCTLGKCGFQLLIAFAQLANECCRRASRQASLDVQSTFTREVGSRPIREGRPRHLFGSQSEMWWDPVDLPLTPIRARMLNQT
jgi:hypothetical protein